MKAKDFLSVFVPPHNIDLAIAIGEYEMAVEYSDGGPCSAVHPVRAVQADHVHKQVIIRL